MKTSIIKVLRYSAFISPAISILGCSHEKVAEAASMPNIVIFLSDDHGAEDAGYMGNRDVSTPVMDHLASEGMIFTRAFAAASVCAPSRASIYTGLYPHRHGCHPNHASIREGIKTLPVYLIEQGYRVALAGKRHINPETAYPFELIKRNEVYNFLKSAGKEPFCLIIAYDNPHEPFFNKKSGVRPQNIKQKEWLPDTPETRRLTAAYYDHVEYLDDEIGTGLYWLEKMGLSENMVQIYTSDHGSGLPFGKWTMYEQGIQVPLIIKWDGVIDPGTKSDAMVSLVDLLPTILDITGAQPPSDLDGRSIMPVIKKESDSHHQYIYAAYTNLGVNYGNFYPIRIIRGERFKLLVNFNHTERFNNRMTEIPDERSLICGHRVMDSWKRIADKYAFAGDRYNQYHYRPRLELYDLNNDPFELNNIAGEAEHGEVLKELLELLKKWMYDQNDFMADKL